MASIQGTCEPRFEDVKRAFAENFRHGEIGASLCVWHGGRVVLDLWGGLAHRERRIPWKKDTMEVLFSATKGLAALCGLLLADRGQLDYEAPLTEYWPELGEVGAQITVRMLFNHRSGLLGVQEPLSLDDLESRERLLPILERQKPVWKPGSRQGYHGVTYGLYVAEIVRRASGGRTVGQLLAEEIAGPLDAEVYLGLPEALDPRVAKLYPAGKKTLLTRILPRLITGLTLEGRIYRAALKKGSLTQVAFAQPEALGARGIRNFDTPRVRRMELAWGGGVGNARGLARVYAALIGADGTDGNALVKRETWEPVTRRQSWQAPDAVLRKPLGWSQGFLKEETRMFSPHPESFGHPGAGGALGWADPVADVAIGYVMNSMDFHLRSTRALRICHALYRTLGFKT